MANIKDIAQLAGVSVATVSRALAKPEVVRPATVRKVQRAIEKLEYRPNAVASSLRRQRSETIIVVVPEFNAPFFSGVVHGIENVAHNNNYRILIGETRGNQERLDRYTSMVTSKSADGLILLGALLPTIVQECLAQGKPTPIPLVLACERFDGLGGPSVQIDNIAASWTATAHLIEAGHRIIATITGPQTNTLGRDRLEGFRAAMEAAGLSLDDEQEVEGGFTVESGFLGMKRLLNSAPRATAVFCASDEMAMGALKAIHDAGLSVPEDIALVGFDDIHFAEFCCPPLTTIAQPAGEIGNVAMELMIELLGKIPNLPKQVILPYRLVERASSLKKKLPHKKRVESAAVQRAVSPKTPRGKSAGK